MCEFLKQIPKAKLLQKNDKKYSFQFFCFFLQFFRALPYFQIMDPVLKGLKVPFYLSDTEIDLLNSVARDLEAAETLSGELFVAGR